MFLFQVPIGTMFKSLNGQILADLNEDGAVFIAARGGAGGKGNHYFATDVNQAPEIAEYGADGEELSYTVEIRTIAHVGLVINYYYLKQIGELILKNLSFEDRTSKCWEIYFPTSHLSCAT